MNKTLLTVFAAAIGATVSGESISGETLLRFAPMPKAPIIDGKIEYNEWKYASTTFGGISPKTKLMTRRQNDFRIGYDAKNVYFAITSEIPLAPQALSADDCVEFQLLPPGKSKPVVIKFDHTGKGKIPAGVIVKNTIGYAVMNAEQGKCWTTEIAVPYSVLGVKGFKDGEKWGLQMIRHWSSQKESGYFHLPAKAGEMATFIPDTKAPIISFDGFGLLMYQATGNHNWTYRIENTQKQKIGIKSYSYRSGVSGAATLDINNPDLFGKEDKKPIGSSQMIAPGKTGLFQLHMMAQFPGKARLLYSHLKGYNNIDYYKRVMFWDVGISRKAASEFTFILAIPVMLGASLLELLDFGFGLSTQEWMILSIGLISAFLVSVFVIKFLLSYIRKHDFKVFGWYRIVLGVLVLICGFVGII